MSTKTVPEESAARQAVFSTWQGHRGHRGAFAGARVAYCELPAGAWIEFLPPFQTGITHLAVSIMGSDCTEHEDVTVLLDRAQVERLRDALSDWLERGVL